MKHLKENWIDKVDIVRQTNESEQRSSHDFKPDHTPKVAVVKTVEIEVDEALASAFRHAADYDVMPINVNPAEMAGVSQIRIIRVPNPEPEDDDE